MRIRIRDNHLQVRRSHMESHNIPGCISAIFLFNVITSAKKIRLIIYVRWWNAFPLTQEETSTFNNRNNIHFESTYWCFVIHLRWYYRLISFRFRWRGFAESFALHERPLNVTWRDTINVISSAPYELYRESRVRWLTSYCDACIVKMINRFIVLKCAALT